MGSGPNGCFTPRTYQHVNLGVAGIVLYPIALLWSFVGTQYIADEYFSVALDGIVELYHIDPDVAGATILAVGTSFPELICGFASQFLSSGGDSGAVAFGVTVGSAIFNQLVIVAACALVSPGGEMHLNFLAILRDMIIWCATIILAMSTLSDGKITVWEAWLYPALYVIYIILCTYWKEIEAKIHGGNPLHGIHKMPRIIKSVVPKRPRHESVAVYAAAHKIRALAASFILFALFARWHRVPRPRRVDGAKCHAIDAMPHADLADFQNVEHVVKEHADHVKVNEDIEQAGRERAATKIEAAVRGHEAREHSKDLIAAHEHRDTEKEYKRPEAPAEGEHPHDADEGWLGGEWPKGCGAQLYFIARAPFAIICYAFQMPKLRRAHRPLLLAPIAGGTCVCIAYLMVAWLETSACVLGVPTISLSLLLAASGTSLPNCLVAMYVAKKGRGTTAVSTVFGSNIFDILIALALPWAIYSSIFGPITVFESLGFGTAYALTTIMIATFALFVILSATNAWVVTHPHAWIYLAIYATFVVYVILDAIPGIVPGPASR